MVRPLQDVATDTSLTAFPFALWCRSQHGGANHVNARCVPTLSWALYSVSACVDRNGQGLDKFPESRRGLALVSEIIIATPA